ncbi:unnamed protein product [Alternaria sp. RS040]
MASQGKRPADGPLQSTKQNSIPPSAKRRVERKLGEYDEFVENDNEDTYHHDPTKEMPPNLPIYHSEFSKAESACLKIPLDFLAAAEADQDPQLAAQLEKRVGTVIGNYQSKPESVAVVGKTGQGKSRLIDAIMGIDQIAKSGGNGVAGTCVSIVYSPRPVNSQLAYRVNVEVIGKRECRTSVRQHNHNIIDGFDDSEGSLSLADDEGPDSITVLKNLFHVYSESASDDAIFAFLGFKHDASDPPSSAEQENIIDNCISRAEKRRLKIAAKFPIYPDNVNEL